MAAGTPVTLTKDGKTREVSTPAEQVKLEFNGWKVSEQKSKKTAPPSS
jgi:hypothetical protein